jgi:copper(I)-binding protein
MARMWPVAKLELRPGETVKFEPNGRHLMFMAISAPFRVGESVPVTFQFDRGETPVTAQLVVRPLVDGATLPHQP